MNPEKVHQQMATLITYLNMPDCAQATQKNYFPHTKLYCFFLNNLQTALQKICYLFKKKKHKL